MKKLLRLGMAILCVSWTAPAKIVDRIVAQVNDDIITLSDLNREMVVIRQDLATKYAGEQLEQEIKKTEKEVLDELIRQKLLLQKATELGFSANVDLQVSATIERIRKENNIKDMQEFERLLAQQGMSLIGYRDFLRKRIITQGLIQEFVGSRITLLSQEVEQYYKEHAQEFSIPEELTLSEILLPPGDNPAEAEARAREIHKRITQGESFATLASQYSKGPTTSKGGGIGTYVTSKLNPEIVAALTNLKDGDITSVMKAKDGYVIYRLDHRKPATLRPLEEVKDEIRDRLYQQKFTPEYERFIAQLREDAYIQVFGESK